LVPRKRSLYQAGFGYGTDTGARMQLGLTRRWVNSRGHSLNSRLRLSEIRQQFTTSYEIPGANPVTDRFALNLRVQDEQSDTIDARSYAIGGSWLQQIGDWERRLSLDWEQESWVFEGVEQDSTLLIPRARFTRTALTPPRGIRSALVSDWPRKTCCPIPTCCSWICAASVWIPCRIAGAC
jgi:translocation and assembly module TamA